MSHDQIVRVERSDNIYVFISYSTGKSALPDIYARRPRVSAYISGKVRVPVL